ncbi:uncharacterized protein LOC122654151 [Telopea speciosissima]|uniref:uncharacterized protein LOC122654151 n=1 Tax=Telopea speciosissima TaxID=54955 RepID=UPI001CC3C353|nr:uncharacterized protein LOC122654151 [Telopea speciosissima]
MGMDQNHHESGEDVSDLMFVKRSGCCFWIPCLGSDRSNAGGRGPVWWERIRNPDNDEQCCFANRNNNVDNEERKWWRKGWNAVLKVREWSEIIAGPRWKTFIRRFNKNNNNNNNGNRGGGLGWKNGKYQYDPMSYALNFDEGHGQDSLIDKDRIYRDFSSRYASIPISVKSSMDLGKDTPSFTLVG